MIRLVFYGLVFYFAYKLVSHVLRLFGGEKPRVEGKPKSKSSLDLNQNDIEDADYEDIS
ncbi:MAG: hypothetical protein O7G31_01005 [Calditrichaeota bacterium]|nr:hypothetical protein [Calditrichota bacterium]